MINRDIDANVDFFIYAAKTEDDEAEEAALKVLIKIFLNDINRIADALEIIASPPKEK